MSDADELVPLAQGNLEAMTKLQKSLSKRGVRSEIRRPPSKDCGGGG